MNPAIASMLERYERRSADDHVNALREILQEIALCGLWRAKFLRACGLLRRHRATSAVRPRSLQRGHGLLALGSRG